MCIRDSRNALEKIIFNLLSNAFKYTPSGGYIRAEIRGNVADGTLHFRIRNSGKGLTEKQMSEIFSRFKIFESSNLKHAGSTGVGLNPVSYTHLDVYKRQLV